MRLGRRGDFSAFHLTYGNEYLRSIASPQHNQPISNPSSRRSSTSFLFQAAFVLFHPLANPQRTIPPVSAEREPMKRRDPQDLNIPLSYLMSASSETLQGFELSRLNHVANLRKEIAAMEEQCEKERIAAEVARWLAEHRDEILRNAGLWLKRANELPSEEVA